MVALVAEILIACPRHGDVRGEFSKSLGCLMAQMGRAGLDFELFMPNSTNLCESRTKAVLHAQAIGATWIQWADTDMSFPPSSHERLRARGLDIVGVNYSRKSAGRRPTAYKADLSGPMHQGSGLEEAAVCGFGFLLMRTEVFATIKRPWFVMQSIPPEHVETLTDDVWMCRKLTAEGHKIMIDHDLSREVSHIGEFAYKLAETA